MSDHSTSSGTVVEQKPKTRVKKPKLFRVILLNDDYTSMDFVVSILESIFRKSPAEATQIMLQVHQKGRGMCGVYAREIAEAKIELVHQRAEEAGYPLRAIMEEE